MRTSILLIADVNGIIEFRINEVEYIHSLTVNGFSCTDIALLTGHFMVVLLLPH